MQIIKEVSTQCKHSLLSNGNEMSPAFLRCNRKIMQRHEYVRVQSRMIAGRPAPVSTWVLRLYSFADGLLVSSRIRFWFIRSMICKLLAKIWDVISCYPCTFPTTTTITCCISMVVCNLFEHFSMSHPYKIANVTGNIQPAREHCCESQWVTVMSSDGDTVWSAKHSSLDGRLSQFVCSRPMMANSVQ